MQSNPDRIVISPEEKRTILAQAQERIEAAPIPELEKVYNKFDKLYLLRYDGFNYNIRVNKDKKAELYECQFQFTYDIERFINDNSISTGSILFHGAGPESEDEGLWKEMPKYLNIPTEGISGYYP